MILFIALDAKYSLYGNEYQGTLGLCITLIMIGSYQPSNRFCYVLIMSGSDDSKLKLMAISLALILALQGVITDVFAAGGHFEDIGWMVQCDPKSDCHDNGEARLDHAAFCHGQHCLNYFAVEPSLLTIIDRNLGLIIRDQHTWQLQIDCQPRIKPPRIS